MSDKDNIGGDEVNGMRAFKSLGTWLEEDGWHPQRLDDKHVYRFGCRGKNGTFTCFAQVHTEMEQLIFYIVAPVNATDERREAVAEFVTRANYGMRIGNFEMDFADGEIRSRSSLDFEGISLSAQLIKNALYPAVQTTDQYLPGLMKVIYGDGKPEDIIGEIEEPSDLPPTPVSTGN